MLGNLYLRPWPIATPRTLQDPKNLEYFDFLYSRTNIGKAAVDKLAELIRATIETRLIINVGLSGSGKTFLEYQLAVQNKAYVLLYDCSTNASVIGDAVRSYLANVSLNRRTESDYYDFSAHIRLKMENYTIANALTLLYLIKQDKITPAQFLRYLENGGGAHIAAVYEAICKVVKTLDTSAKLRKHIFGKLYSATPLPFVEAWDEAGLLTQWGSGCVPWESQKSKFNHQTHKLNTAGSTFTIMCRIAKLSESHKTIASGTALRLIDVEKDMSKDFKDRVLYLMEEAENYLLPWIPDKVCQNLAEDIAVNKIQETVLNAISYITQGRARVPQVFKNLLFKIKSTHPTLDDSTACLM